MFVNVGKYESKLLQDTRYTRGINAENKTTLAHKSVALLSRLL